MMVVQGLLYAAWAIVTGFLGYSAVQGVRSMLLPVSWDSDPYPIILVIVCYVVYVLLSLALMLVKVSGVALT